MDNTSAQVATMIRLQELTGMRPGEVVLVRTCDIEMSGAIWTYTPATHKTEHHGHERVIYLGPRAQEVLRPWLRTNLQAWLFQPREAEEARQSLRRANRKTPMTPSQAARKPKQNPKHPRRDRYTVDSYRRAIEYGITKANKHITKANKDTTDTKDLIPHWHPHQLRHSAATRLCRLSGYNRGSQTIVLDKIRPMLHSALVQFGQKRRPDDC
jgi:integrase